MSNNNIQVLSHSNYLIILHGEPKSAKEKQNNIGLLIAISDYVGRGENAGFLAFHWQLPWPLHIEGANSAKQFTYLRVSVSSIQGYSY